MIARSSSVLIRRFNSLEKSRTAQVILRIILDDTLKEIMMLQGKCKPFSIFFILKNELLLTHGLAEGVS